MPSPTSSQSGNLPDFAAATSSVGAPAPSNSVVVLTPEQDQSSWIEIRNPQGKTLGFLARSEDASHFFTSEEMAAIQRRAKEPVPGKTFSEIFAAARQRIEG